MLSGQEAPVCTFDRLIQCSVALCLNVFLHCTRHVWLLMSLPFIHLLLFVQKAPVSCLNSYQGFTMYSNVARGEAPLLKFFDIA